MLRVLRLVAAALVALPALALTLSLLVGWSFPAVVALQAFSPLAVPAYAAALVLLLVPIGGRTSRRVVLAGGGFLVVVLVASTVIVAPRWTGGAAAVAPGDPKLVVMTSNLRLGEADAAAVVRVARAENVDLLVLEELTPGLQRRIEAHGLTDFLPHRAGTPGPGAKGTVVYSRSPITDVRAIATDHKSLAFTVEGLRIFGVHPAYPFAPGWAKDQALLATAARAEHPDVVLGDTNSSLDNPLFRDLLSTGLEDAAEQSNAGWQPTWPVDGFRGLPVPLAAIDHVLVGEKVVALATRVHDIPGTDHRALVADLAVVGD